MFEITAKTSRLSLIAEINSLRDSKKIAQLEHDERIATYAAKLVEAHDRAAHAEHKVEVLETDVQNMLGTIRVMADSSREVRIRKSSVRDSDLCYALPVRNTDKL